MGMFCQGASSQMAGTKNILFATSCCLGPLSPPETPGTPLQPPDTRPLGTKEVFGSLNPKRTGLGGFAA